MQNRNVWRDTARSPRLFLFDAKIVIPIFIFMLSISWFTFGLLIACISVLAIVERFGFSIPVAMRWCRSWLAGPVRYGVSWWHRPQKRLLNRR
jgi:intracellular multiplication protein IcmT